MSENRVQFREFGRGRTDVSVKLKRTWRILRSVATGVEVGSEYAAKVLRNRISRAIRSRQPQVLADRAVEVFWNGLPRRVRSWKPTRALGRRIHRRACRIQARGGACYTRFFRNLPQLEFIRDLVLEMPPGRSVKVLSIGCSTGAELYSALWLIRTARPTRAVQALGVDISEECIQAASRGVYPFRVPEVAAAGISETSHERFFTREGKTLVVQDWVKEAVRWAVGDACSPDLAARFGLHDVVLANNFLFHMSPERSAACLRNLARLVAPDSYLVVSGVDLDLRGRILGELGFVPVTARWEEIHAAEDVHASWPLRFWGLEPIDRTRQNWPARYATIFRSPAKMGAAQ
jgi:SAM-dependent methyltransferase